jgi:hypothetical protein
LCEELLRIARENYGEVHVTSNLLTVLSNSVIINLLIKKVENMGKDKERVKNIREENLKIT